MSKNVYFPEDIERINSQFVISDDTVIFRYMDFTNYMELLENRKLFFCNPKQYEDAFEGEMPYGFYNGWNQQMIESHTRILKKKDDIYNSYVSCWNMGAEESYALWKIYTNPNTGIAIKSTVGSLKRSLNNDLIKTYKVHYIDSFEKLGGHIEPPFEYSSTGTSRRVKEVYKLSSYRYENEMRAIYTDKSNEYGKKFDVDLEVLIHDIHISPFASNRFFNLVKRISDQSHYLIKDKEIKQSEIKLRKKE